MAGKDNTTRIEILENQAANLVARLDVQDVLVKGITEGLKKWSDICEGHTTKITVIEQNLFLVDLKVLKETISTIEKDIVAIRKDVESLGKWKDDLKKEKEETVRRRWAFGPNITAALISGVITFIGIWINYLLNRPK